MIPFTVYDKITGEIIRTGVSPNAAKAAKQSRDGKAVLLRRVKFSQYIVNGKAVDRPTITIPDAASAGAPVMLGHIPSHSVIAVNGDPVGVTDGTDLELTFDLDGEYEVSIDLPFPWVPIKQTIKVSP